MRYCAIWRYAVGRAHLAATELHHVQVEDFLQCRDLHGVRNDVAETGEVGIPLAGGLVGLNVVSGFAARVVSKILAAPKLRNVSLLALLEKAHDTPRLFSSRRKFGLSPRRRAMRPATGLLNRR